MKKINLYKLLTIALATVMIAVVGAGCADKWQDGKVKVMTTLFPYYDLARTIGGDRADVKSLLKPGADSHGYEPTARQVANIQESDIFVYTGKDMEYWAEKIISGLDSNTHVVDVSHHIEEHEHGDHDHNHDDENDHDHDHDHDDEHDHDHTAYNQEIGEDLVMPMHSHDHDHNHEDGVDPHVWLDVNNMVIAAEAIEEAYVAADSANAEYYRANAKVLIDSLIKLDKQFHERIEAAGKTKLIFTGHFAYGIMLEAYGIDNYITLLEGVTEDEEAKVGNRTAIENILTDTQNPVRHMFYDYDDAKPVAQQIAKDVKKKNPSKEIILLKLHSLENLSKSDYNAGKTYIDIMKENLDNLIVGLNG